MRGSVLVLASFLLLALAPPADAAPEEPIGNGRLGRVRVGWGGFVPATSVAPVVVLLANPDGHERTVRVAVWPRSSTGTEVTVVLAPRATGRASFVVRAPDGLEVTLSEGGMILASSRHATQYLPERAVLEVDGSPATRTAPALLSPAPAAFPCRVEDLPTETACYSPFGVVVLRLVDTARIDERALAALRDYVRRGGTVIVSGTPGFYDGLGNGAPEPGPVPMKHHGLGHVALVACDLGAITSAAEVGRSAVAEPCARALPHSFVPARLSFTENEALKGPRLSYTLFLLGYAFVGGPLCALLLRRVRNRKRAWTLAAVVVLGFVVAGAVVATVARHGTGRATVLSYLLVPGEGEPLVLAEATLESGGSLRPDVSVEGEDLAVTALMRPAGWRWIEDSVETRRCTGRGSVAFPAFPLPNFGQETLVITAAAPGVQRVEAWVERTDTGGRQLVVRNTTGRDLGPTALYDRFGTNEFKRAAFATIRAGETAIAPITSAESAVYRIVPGFQGLQPGQTHEGLYRRLERLPRRYVLATRVPPPLRLHASHSSVDEGCWRLQSVRGLEGPPGWIGLTLAPSAEGALTVTSVAPGSPAAIAGIQKGERILQLASIDIGTAAEAATVLEAVGPGGHLIARVADAQGRSRHDVGLPVLAEPVSGRFRGARFLTR